MVEKKEEVKEEYQAIQVPTNYAQAVGTPSGEAMSIEQSLAVILNQLAEIKKVLG